MSTLLPFYSISNRKSLEVFLKVYIPLVNDVAKRLGVDLAEREFVMDHLGVQVRSKEEFDSASEELAKYSKLIHDNVIHDRRNRVYEFNDYIEVERTKIARLEIFEPKPGADKSKLKPGVEHAAYTVSRQTLDSLERRLRGQDLIDKVKEFEDGSKFFKTRFLDLVEIEFRDDNLGVK